VLDTLSKSWRKIMVASAGKDDGLFYHVPCSWSGFPRNASTLGRRPCDGSPARAPWPPAARFKRRNGNNFTVIGAVRHVRPRIKW